MYDRFLKGMTCVLNYSLLAEASLCQCAVSFIFSYMSQNEFSVCKTEAGGGYKASLTDNNAADGNSGTYYFKIKQRYTNVYA